MTLCNKTFDTIVLVIFNKNNKIWYRQIKFNKNAKKTKDYKIEIDCLIYDCIRIVVAKNTVLHIKPCNLNKERTIHNGLILCRNTNTVAGYMNIYNFQ